MQSRSIFPGLAALVGALCFACCAAALEPDEIALVVNSRVPFSRELAELYARQRHVPQGRIIELSIDPDSVISPAESMPQAQFEPLVAQPVRNFLIQNQLKDKVICLVTFWGLPLRIDRRILTPAENQELAEIRQELTQTRLEVSRQIGFVEQSATRLDPSFGAAAGDELPQLTQRLNAALVAVFKSLPGVPDPTSRMTNFLQVVSTCEKLLGTPKMRELMSEPALAGVVPRRPTEKERKDAEAQLADADRRISELLSYAPTSQQRAESRQIAKQVHGLFGLLGQLSAQEESFHTEESEAALDSELALIWWKNYPRSRWIDNPLNWRLQSMLRSRRMSAPDTLMVTRIDGPSEQIARALIETSLQVESKGLSGQVVLDARGKPATDPYGQYDQSLRELNILLKRKTALKVYFDDKAELISAHSLSDPIALYCGWYSLRNYAPPGPFAPGAVGFHVASLELVSLRQPGEHGWVRGLLSDGVTGTLGPVAEPYLQSFPPATDFFALLLTGKLALAEVYWRTIPSASWMQTCIADPLYTPYKHNPALQIEDLPQVIREAFLPPYTAQPGSRPQTQPATQPNTTQPAALQSTAQ